MSNRVRGIHEAGVDVFGHRSRMCITQIVHGRAFAELSKDKFDGDAQGNRI